jgi:hypothetical protein
MSIKEENKLEKSKAWKRILFFFPFQLVVLHFKRNHLLMFFWLLLFLYVTQTIGSDYGVTALFLAPEYLGTIGIISFGILGFALGGFMISFNIYSYILHAKQFQFLAATSRPFIKFCYNNFIIPMVFYLVLLYKSYNFQVHQELITSFNAVMNLIGLSLGILIFLLISTLFFRLLNKNIFNISGKDEAFFESNRKSKKANSVLLKDNTLYSRMSRKRRWVVETYIHSPFSIRVTRDTSHYDRHLLKQVFAQNNVNASIFELVLLMSFIAMGVFREFELFNIPAGASILLLFTIFLFIFSALYSWFRGWTLTLIIAIVMLLNFVSNNSEGFKFRNYAYGMDYSIKTDYSWNSIKKKNSDKKRYDYSFNHTLKILENWKTKNRKLTGKTKPKLILLNISGGGLRASTWTLEVLQALDTATDGRFFEQTQLITGASGGMLGVSYYRELFLQSKTSSTIDRNNHHHVDLMGTDLLNPLAFSIATSDLLFRYQSFKDGNYTYTKDRGYVFEQKLVQNLEGTFSDTRLFDYYVPEMEAEIPMIVFSPVVVNDGRRMLISPQPISYLSYADDSVFTSTYHSTENIEFSHFFERNNSVNLRYTTAMRMSATFPYILPMVSMPTEPAIELMDAGVRDNFGIKTSVEFLRAFKNWISTNTSGVILVQIRDKEKYFETKNASNGSIFQRLFAPFNSFYSNTVRIHDYNNDQFLYQVKDWFPGEFDVVSFYLHQPGDKKVSMSWHLTNLDKKHIREAIFDKDNQQSILRIKNLLK